MTHVAPAPAARAAATAAPGRPDGTRADGTFAGLLASHATPTPGPQAATPEVPGGEAEDTAQQQRPAEGDPVEVTSETVGVVALLAAPLVVDPPVAAPPTVSDAVATEATPVEAPAAPTAAGPTPPADPARSDATSAGARPATPTRATADGAPAPTAAPAADRGENAAAPPSPAMAAEPTAARPDSAVVPTASPTAADPTGPVSPTGLAPSRTGRPAEGGTTGTDTVRGPRASRPAADGPRPGAPEVATPATAAPEIAAPEVDVAAAPTELAPSTPRPVEVPRTPTASAAVDRVLRAVELLEHAPPPRRISVEVDGLQLTVAMQGEEVSVAVRAGADHLAPTWQRDLAGALRGRGLGLADGPATDGAGTHGGRRDDQPSDQRRQSTAGPTARPHHPRPTDPTTDGLQL